MRSACCAAAGCRHDQRYTEPLCDLVRLILADIKPGNGAVEQCLKRIDMLARPMLAFRAGVKAAYGFMDKRLLSIEQAGAEIITVDAIGEIGRASWRERGCQECVELGGASISK